MITTNLLFLCRTTIDLISQKIHFTLTQLYTCKAELHSYHIFFCMWMYNVSVKLSSVIKMLSESIYMAITIINMALLIFSNTHPIVSGLPCNNVPNDMDRNGGPEPVPSYSPDGVPCPGMYVHAINKNS